MLKDGGGYFFERLCSEWNAKWVSYDRKIWYAAILVCSGTMLVAALAIIVCLFLFYGGNGCDLNNFFISFTLILSVAAVVGSMLVSWG